ncbi:hypothetical protein [Actinomadura soli]|uniref:hypothetical protein n=1 Tax=Actinomadura soli TaxID=2508997 RepID=UPI00197AF015|nr:hypothetical protein [Actinomadura soli]
MSMETARRAVRALRWRELVVTLPAKEPSWPRRTDLVAAVRCPDRAKDRSRLDDVLARELPRAPRTSVGSPETSIIKSHGHGRANFDLLHLQILRAD